MELSPSSKSNNPSSDQDLFENELPPKETHHFLHRFMRISRKLGVKSVLMIGLFLLVTLAGTAAAISPLNQWFSSKASDSLTATYIATQVVNEDGSSYSTSSPWFGNGESKQSSYTGLYFTGDPLPADAEITHVELKVYSQSKQWISQSVRVYAQLGNTVEKFSSSSRPSQRPLSQQYLSYSDNSSWQANKVYSFPNLLQLAPVIQQHEGSFALILKGTGNSWGRKFISGTDRSARAPQVIISYTVPSAEPSPTPDSEEDHTGHESSPIPSPESSPNPDEHEGHGGSEPTPSPSSTPDGNGDPGHTHDQSGENSHAMGLWEPSKWDTCPNPEDTVRIKEIHDSYFVYGPDGKKYPTWHPPVDPETGCKFGHEHGRDPNQSALMPFIKEYYGCQDKGEHCGVPFGYVNESLDRYNAANGINNGMRHEDHVGHKIEWENNLDLIRNNCANTPASPGCFTSSKIGVQCDFLMKPHQGTHSKDAFTNNMHELAYFVQCRGDGPFAATKLAASKMVLFGRPGSFFDGTVDQGGREIKVGNATPMNSPAGGGARSIPAISKVREHILVPQGQWSLYSNGLYEDWISSNYIISSTGRQLVYYDPHFAVFSPSRFFWPGNESAEGITRSETDKTNNMGRSIDVCYMSENGGSERYRGGECDALTNYGQNRTPISWDDPRSPFNGVVREMYFNQTGIDNTGGPTIWYSDPFGRNAVAATPGSEQAKTLEANGYVRHYIAPINNSLNYALESQAIGGDRNYGGNGVHAPN